MIDLPCEKMIPSYAILLVNCFAVMVWIFSDVDESIFHPVVDGRDESIKEAEGGVVGGHFGSESFDQSASPRCPAGMFALDYLLHSFVCVTEGAFVGIMHAEAVKLMKGWKYIVAYFCEKYVTIYSVDGK